MRIGLLLATIFFTDIIAADHGPEIWRRAHPSVVSVMPTWPGYERPGFGAPRGTAPEGSGIIYSLTENSVSNKILTAAHVVDRATKVQIQTHDLQRFNAKVEWVDTDSDIAILSIDSKLPSLQLTDIPFSPGEHVCALANPFGLGISMSCGVISGLNRTDIGFNAIEDFVQTDAAVNPGSSGGALVNSDGQLLGMIAAIFTKEADIDAGVNFAISASLLLARVNQSPNP